MRILGIDPSLCCTGWGIIDVIEDGTVQHIDHGAIKVSLKSSTEKRLSQLSTRVTELINKYKPDIACLEETFCGLNPVTTLRLGFASGALLCTFGLRDIEVIRYPTRLVKMLITSNGGSSKQEVFDRMLNLLSLDTIDGLDASDALAVAMTHYLQTIKNNDKVAQI